jgi:hypothetical protein
MLQWLVYCVWNVMAHAQKPDFVFRRKGRVHLNRQGRQFNRLLAAKVCASAVVMLDTPCSEVVWGVLATHSIRQFPLYSLSRTSPCAITYQLDSTHSNNCALKGWTYYVPTVFLHIAINMNYNRNRNLYSSVSAVTRLRAGWPGKRQKQVISPSLQSPEQLWGLITPPFICQLELFLGV